MVAVDAFARRASSVNAFSNPTLDEGRAPTVPDLCWTCEEVMIEIVAYSHGLHMLREDTSPLKQEIRDLRAKIPQVSFAACDHTKNAMEKREGKPVPMIAEATMVPAGVVRLMELQDEGYTLRADPVPEPGHRPRAFARAVGLCRAG